MIPINILESVCLALKEEENTAKFSEIQNLEVEHPDCENCVKKKGKNSCTEYKNCGPFREWFSYVWNGIREAAKKLKEGEPYDTK